MKKIFTQIILSFLFSLVFYNGYAQISFTENWDSGLNSWTTVGGYNAGQTTITPCSVGSLRANIYDTDPTNVVTSPLIGTSNGGEVTLSYLYKIINFTGGGGTPNPWGNFVVQYAASASGPWTTVQTVNQTNHTASTSCVTKTITFYPAPGDFYLRFSATWSSGDFYIYYDELNISQGAPPSCIAPSNLLSSALTATAATFGWDASSSTGVAGYEWEVRSTGAAGSGASGLVSSGTTTTALTTPSVNTLTANTSYTFYVRTNCGSSFSAWSSYAFSTPCASITALPFTEGFNAAALPTCWSRNLISGTNNWITGDGTLGDIPTPQSGTRFIYKPYNTSTAELVTPPVNLAALGTSGGRISVWVYRFASTVAADVINFYINSTPSSTGGTLLLAIHPLTTEAPAETASGWYKYTADIPTTFNTAGTVYFVTEGITTAGFSSYDLGIDNFTVEQIPSCVEPTLIVASAITTTGAQLDWTAPATAPSTYQIYYNTTNTTPTLATTPTITGVTGTTYTLASLTPGTQYYVWVRSRCGAGDSSIWSLSTSFITGCVAINSFPYTQSFDNAADPACWTKSLITGTYNWGPATSNDGVPSARTGARFAGKVYNASDALFVSPEFNTTAFGTSTARVSVWIYRNTVNKANDELKFFVNTTPDITGATPLLDIYPLITIAPAVTASGWYNYTAEIPVSYNTGTFYVVAEGITDGSFTSYGIGFDDFVVEQTPSCLEPTAVTVSNITSTGIQLDWTASTSGTPTYEVYYSTTNTAPTATSTPNVLGITGITTNIGSLTPATTYYLWMRSKCGTSSYSVWTPTAVVFTTNCVTVATFNQNFDAVTTPNLPVCWSKILRGATLSTFASVGTVTGTANTTPNSVNLYNSSSASTDDIILVSPVLSNLGAATHRLRFYAKNSTASEDLEIGTLSDNTSTAVFTVLQPVDINTTYQEYTVDFSNYTGTDQYIGIRRLNTSTYTNVYVDDIIWEAIPTCIEPNTLVVSAITANSAQLDWTAPATAPSSYEIYYNTTNTAPTATTTPTVTGITSTTYNFTLLSGGTTYYVWIRSNCGAGGTGIWVSKSFATLPTNDDCSTPITLVNNTTVNGTTVGATQSIAAELCNGFTGTADDDVWYSFTATYNGDVTIVVTPTPTPTSSDFVAIAYSGTCGSLNSIGCSDALSGPETINLSGLIAGETYLLRIYSYNNLTGQGAFTINATGSALPVSLTLFTGERRNNVNVLNWKTANELNNTGFDLQRSADGKSFSSLAFIKTKAENGTTANSISYTFIDENPFTANNYYRLKQIDKDGKSALSEVVLIKGIKVTKLELVNVYPNPAKAKINLVLSSPKSSTVTYIITDITGKVVLQQVGQVIAGDNNFSINVQALRQGSYLVKVVCADGCETAIKKFVKD